MGKLKRLGKGSHSSVYMHPTKDDCVLILGRDMFKDMLVDNRYIITEELRIHLPELECIGMLDYDTVYECKKYEKLTKKHFPKVWEDYRAIMDCLLSLPNRRVRALAELPYTRVHHNTALCALWELAHIACSYTPYACIDYHKANFMVNPDTGALVLNDLFCQ